MHFMVECIGINYFRRVWENGVVKAKAFYAHVCSDNLICLNTSSASLTVDRHLTAEVTSRLKNLAFPPSFNAVWYLCHIFKRNRLWRNTIRKSQLRLRRVNLAFYFSWAGIRKEAETTRKGWALLISPRFNPWYYT